MKRSAFVLAVLVLAAAGGAASAQAERVWRLGFLSSSFGDGLTIPRRAVVAELGRQGFVEGRNLLVEVRSAEGELEKLPELARDLAQWRPDAIVAVSSAATRASKEAAPETPVVMAFASEDPIAAGLVSSLANPGGMVTGIALPVAEGDTKRAELIREALPGAKHLVLLASKDPEHGVELTHRTAAAAGVELAILRAGVPSDYDLIFPLLRGGQPDGLVIGAAALFLRDVSVLAPRATELKLPTVCPWREMAQAGCLLSYGPSLDGLYGKIGGYVARIFQGAKPAELPVEQPTAFELVVNLKTAQALSLTVPPSILSRANEMIE
jgi:putative tryptophan/tyrosine transport system substrate-binding protein